MIESEMHEKKKQKILWRESILHLDNELIVKISESHRQTKANFCLFCYSVNFGISEKNM